MAVTTTVRVGDLDVSVHELTVGEIRDWFRSPAPEFDVVDAMLTRDVSMHDLYRMTDLTPEAAQALTPSEVIAVAAAAREVNADFFAGCAWLAQQSRQMTEASAPTPRPAQNSSGSSVA